MRRVRTAWAALLCATLVGTVTAAGGAAPVQGASVAMPHIDAIHMFDPTVGVAIERAPFALLETTSGAGRWTLVAGPSPSLVFVAWGFTPAGLVWVQAADAGGDHGASGASGALPGSRLWTRAPGAGTWTVQRLDPEAGTVFEFLTDRSALSGRIFGRGAGHSLTALYRSGDAGASWREVATVPNGDPTGFTFADAATGWMTGYVPVQGDWNVAVTSDDGTSWRALPLTKPAGLAGQQGSSNPPLLCSGAAWYLTVQVMSPPYLRNNFVVYEAADAGATWAPAVRVPTGAALCGPGGRLYVSAWPRLFVIRGRTVRHLRLPRRVFLVTDAVTANLWYARGSVSSRDPSGWYVTDSAGRSWAPLALVVRRR